MARFYEVDIPNEGTVYQGVQKILGVGPWEASCLCNAFGIGKNQKVGDLESEEWHQITDWFQKHGLVEKERRAEVRNHIRHEIELMSYRGLRHQKGYPVRGQRTHTNASRPRKRF